MEETLRAAALRRESLALHEPSCGYAARKQPGGQTGDRRIGVVWHTQGSGKSLTMAFYAGRIIREPAMENPTIGVLTGRNDLDDQQDLLRQPPVQAVEDGATAPIYYESRLAKLDLPEELKLTRKMWRVVRPGGRVLISTPYRERIRYVLCIHSTLT